MTRTAGGRRWGGGIPIVTVVLGVLLGAGVAQAAGTFVDDDGNTHEGYIEAIAAEGITKGCNPPTNDRYCPGDSVTRGQMAAFLVRALDLPAGQTDLFGDDDGSVFEDDIDRLATAGITKGCNPPDNDRYCPDDPVTRGQMAAFLVRAFGYEQGAGSDSFGDDDGSVFEDDIDLLATAGITKGCNPPDNDRFCPDDLVRRDQMASFLGRALGLQPIAVGGDYTCTEVIGFSQTGGLNPEGLGWFRSGFETAPGIVNGEWQLRWDTGKGIDLIADPDNVIWEKRVESACSAGPVDRVVVQISHSGIAFPTVDDFVRDIGAAIATIRGKHPSVERIDLMPVIGGPGHALCDSPDGSGFVRATVNHPVVDQAIARLVGGDVGASLSPEVDDCSWYRDKPGHLYQFGSDAIALEVADFYG